MGVPANLFVRQNSHLNLIVDLQYSILMTPVSSRGFCLFGPVLTPYTPRQTLYLN